MKTINDTIKKDSKLVSYCGLYCGACKKYINELCKGCKEKETPEWCKVKPCNESKKTDSCSECNEVNNYKNCTKLYPLSYKFGEFIAGMSREAGLNMIKNKGKIKFAEFMEIVNKTLCIKRKNIKNSIEY
jgi:hypothetical protein